MNSILDVLNQRAIETEAAKSAIAAMKARLARHVDAQPSIAEDGRFVTYQVEMGIFDQGDGRKAVFC